MEKYIKALNVKRQVEERFLHVDGIHGLSIGYDNITDENSDKICIYFHLHNPKPVKLGLIPKSIMGVPTHILETEIPQPQQDKKAYRPLIGGCRIESSNNISGTLGFVVTEKSSQKKVALTCQHVLNNEGDIMGQPIFDINNMIGTNIRGVLSKQVDAAICSLEGIKCKPNILEIGQIAGSYAVSILDIKYGGYPIRKRGMATGLTFGIVKHLHYTGYRSDGWRFHDQLWIEGDENIFASNGDSGSVYVDVHNRIVGLHWGSEGNNNGVGSPIENVLNELNIEIPTTNLRSQPSSWIGREIISEFLY